MYDDFDITQLLLNNKGDTILHVDLDYVYVCRDKYEEQFCTVENVLEVNCEVIRQLTNIPDLDCSFPDEKIANTINAADSILDGSMDRSDVVSTAGVRTKSGLITLPKVYAEAGMSGNDFEYAHNDRINERYAIEECIKRKAKNDSRRLEISI